MQTFSHAIEAIYCYFIQYAVCENSILNIIPGNTHNHPMQRKLSMNFELIGCGHPFARVQQHI